MLRAILTGAALGPVFSSCSPTYSLVLATVFPASFALGMWYTVLYSLGLALAIVPIALGGRAVVKKLGWLADERSAFKKVLGILLVLVGLSIVTGFEKAIETAALERFDLQFIERGILDSVTGDDMDTPVVQAGSSDDSRMDVIPYNVSIPYPAPELALSDWINSEPLTMESLRGKVVLIDFWTYSCINCQRTLSYLSDWYAKYRDDGLVIIGVHAPEFAFERIPANVAEAVKEAGIGYPVGLDNDYSLWNAYRNRYWPAKYFIDREGRVRHTHFGEGAYDESERVIRGLLGLTDATGATTDTDTSMQRDTVPVSSGQSPETYLGSARRANFVPDATDLGPNEWTLSGSWQTEGQYIESIDAAGLSYRFSAKDVYLVLSGTGTADIRVDGALPSDTEDLSGGTVRVDGSRLYHIFAGDSFVQ